MLSKEERNKLYEMQYNGTIRAIDLPMEYKMLDRRVYCAKEWCRFSQKCLFFERYVTSPFRERLNLMRCIEKAKLKPDKNGNVNYGIASYGMCPPKKKANRSQRGTSMCDYYVLK